MGSTRTLAYVCHNTRTLACVEQINLHVFNGKITVLQDLNRCHFQSHEVITIHFNTFYIENYLTCK